MIRILIVEDEARLARLIARVLGEEGYASLAEVPFEIDCVDVFRRSEAAGEFADQAVATGAKAVWFQLGVIDQDALRRTRAAGVRMVMDACPAIEWRRRRGRAG